MMFDQISQIINGMLHTMQGSRIAVTVAEQNQPFVTQWFSNFGLLFFAHNSNISGSRDIQPDD